MLQLVNKNNFYLFGTTGIVIDISCLTLDTTLNFLVALHSSAGSTLEF